MPMVTKMLTSTVYDVTKYLEDHPGGSIILREVAGTDATQGFVEVGHSADADDVLKELYIGDLAADVRLFTSPEA